MKQKPYVLIMAGGSGTRLWPFSRSDKPKQLLQLYGSKSLLEHTIDRALQLTKAKNIFIGTNEALMKQIRKSIPAFKSKKQFIIEPMGKNTAPAIALFIEKLKQDKIDGDTPLLILSADHYVEPAKDWAKDIEGAYEQLNQYLFCFGVQTRRPDTGYGYIETAEQLKTDGTLKKIASFREKPDKTTAKKYHESNNYLWNTGVFLFSMSAIYEEFQQHQPEILKLAQEFFKAKSKKRAALFSQMPDISIDYAIMEKSSKLAVICSSVNWDDVGSYEALSRIQPADDNENFTEQAGQVLSLDANDNIILADSTVSLLGIQNCVVVEKNGVILVAARSSLEKIKEVRELAPDNKK